MGKHGARFVEVAVEGPLRTTFNYEWGTPLGDVPEPGVRLAVPFGGATKTAYLLREVGEDEARAAAGGRELREVAYARERVSLVTPGVLELARWMWRHYLAGPGEVMPAALPGGVRKDRRAARVKVVTALAARGALVAEADRAETRSPRRARALRILAERREIPAPELAGGKSDAALVRWLVARGLAEVKEVPREEVARAPAPPPPAPGFELTPAQRLALEKVHELIGNARAGRPPFGLLLEGVTGSGKTEVYLRAIGEEVASGRQAIVLVPEIALTPQTIARFGERFGRIAVLHSHLTDGQRADEWRRIRAGEVDVVIGARSAVFAPLPCLGLVVVDEEHEPSYKQPSSPRYHARDAALARARIERAAAILGSATPSLESYLAARTGALAHAVLPERIGGRPLPPVEVVDMQAERREVKGFPILSRRLARALVECLSRGEQALLFINRRGYFTFVRCPRCGADVRCAKCDVPMTVHRAGRSQSAAGALRCHYCGEEVPYPVACRACGFGKLLPLGTGTEKVVDEVVRAAPGARVGRMDTDAMLGREDYERVLGGFRDGQLDVLVGTQMIAKGLDLPRVTLVGVVNADVALNLPDFRASERAFQLIAQVAGRAGRSDLGGSVVVQTSLPESLAVRAGAKHDIAAFAEEELEHRRLFWYPPFAYLARIVVEGPREEAVEKRIGVAASALGAPDVPEGAGYTVLGPSEAPLGRLRGRRRQHLIVKAADPETLEELLWKAEPSLRTSGATRLAVDVDPVNMR